MIKYLGSKRLLIKNIIEVVSPSVDIFSDDASAPGIKSAADVFSGTCRVGYAMKNEGIRVVSNDLNNYAYCIAKCYIEGDEETHSKEVKDIITELNGIKGSAGYVTETFCEKSRYFMPKNGERIDAIRDEIESRKYPEPLKSILITSLIEAADRIDSTCGVQMAYLKEYADRAHNNIHLTVPILAKKVDGCAAFLGDAADFGAKIGHVDLAYLDPPYNQHSYLGNYHIWESIVLWDKPDVYGTACKRIDVRSRKSDFNLKGKIADAFTKTVNNLDADVLVVSFSNEGYLEEDDIVRILGGESKVTVYRNDFTRYIGAKIGIHDLKGNVVGEVSHTRNEELIFVARR